MRLLNIYLLTFYTMVEREIIRENHTTSTDTGTNLIIGLVVALLL